MHHFQKTQSSYKETKILCDKSATMNNAYSKKGSIKQN